MARSAEFPQYAFVPPRSYTRGRKAGQPTVIVIHTTQGTEGVNSAENGAAYDARRTDGTSAHFFTDQDTTVQCVLTTDEAHTARRHGNDVGIQIEVCARAEQNPEQWRDPASAGAIEQTARLCVALRAKYGKERFPLHRLSPVRLRAGERGFAGHGDCTAAWPEDNGSHTDPGPNFPWSRLFARIAELEEPPPNTDKGDDMAEVTLSQKSIDEIAEACRVAVWTQDVNAGPASNVAYNTVWGTFAKVDAMDDQVTAILRGQDALNARLDEIVARLPEPTPTEPPVTPTR